MTQIKNMEIEFLCGNTIERAVKELKEASRTYNCTVSGSFNGKMLNSDMSVDEAYLLIVGSNKKDFDDKIEKQREEYKRAEEEHKIKTPSLIEEYKNKARGIISGDKLGMWDEIVPIRLVDLYRGAELEHTLTLTKMLDIDKCSLEEANTEFNKQSHSGMSAHLVFSMMLMFCVRGQAFVEYVKKIV